MPASALPARGQGDRRAPGALKFPVDSAAGALQVAAGRPGWRAAGGADLRGAAARPAPLCCLLASPGLHAQGGHRLGRREPGELLPGGSTHLHRAARGLGRRPAAAPPARDADPAPAAPQAPSSAGGGRGLVPAQRQGAEVLGRPSAALSVRATQRRHLRSRLAGRAFPAHGMALSAEPECAQRCAADLGPAARGPRGPGRESERPGVGTLALDFPAHRGGASGMGASLPRPLSVLLPLSLRWPGFQRPQVSQPPLSSLVAYSGLARFREIKGRGTCCRLSVRQVSRCLRTGQMRAWRQEEGQDGRVMGAFEALILPSGSLPAR